MDAKYFCSQGISLGVVKASTARTFKDLIDRHFNIAIPLNVTREAYQALSKEEKDSAKKVPYLTPAAFRSSPARRVFENALHCNLIFIDIDEDKDIDPVTKRSVPNGVFPAAAYVNNPDTLAAQLKGWNWAAYTTASSTPQGPRMRLVIDADSIPVASYPAAVKTIAKRIGLPILTTESKVAVQAMYLPTLFVDQDESEHPLIDYVLDGRAFTKDDIDPDGTYIEAARAQPGTGGKEISALEFLRAPVEEVTIEIATEALQAIDPDLNYHDWLGVATALKHQFAETQEEEAFTLFDEWSQGGSKYKGEEETRAKWDSFLQTPAGRVPVTIRSLLKKATEGGWSPAVVKDECFNGVLHWIQRGAKSSSQLMSEGLKRIATTPLISKAEEDALVHQIVIECKKRFGLTVTLAVMRKELKKVAAELEVKEAGPKQSVPPWAKGLVYVADGNFFLRQRTHEIYQPEELDHLYGKRLLPTEDMLRAAGITITPATLCKPFVRPTDFLLNHIKCPTAYQTLYDPSSPDDLFPIEEGRVYVNTYRRTHPDANEANGIAAGIMLRRHLEKLILEPEYVQTVLDYMAYLVQHPGKKIRWAILLQGAEGCGKTFLAEVLRLVLGKEHVMAIDIESIKRGWSEWSTGKQVVVIEEIRVVGQNRHEIMGVLKPLITNPRITINQRNKDTRETDNRTNYIAFTNHSDALALTPGTRRWFVLRSRIQTPAQVKAMGGDEYFSHIFNMATEHAAGLRWFLENWRISDSFQPNGHAPSTPYLRALIQDSASELVAAVRKILREAEHPLVQADLLSSKVLLDLLHAQEDMHKVSSQQLGGVLRDENFTQQDRHLVEGTRHYMWTHDELFDPKQNVQKVAEDRLKMGIRLPGADVLG